MRAFAHDADARRRTAPGNGALLVRHRAGQPDQANGSARFGHDFGRIAAYGPGSSRSDRTKSPEDSPLLDEEVTQPDAGVGTTTPAPTDAGAPAGGGAAPADAGVKSKKAKLKSGPTYTPSGTVKATKSGGSKTATFQLAAEFEHDPANGIDAALGEVRQYIKWTKAEDPPKTGAFTPTSAYSGDTWYEDRDPAGKRYGHRSGTHAECVSINHYEDAAGKQVCATGAKYVGKDVPVAAGSRTGKWSFELRALDTASGADIGTPASVAIDWNV